jgi:4-hydroxy-2-oxoheptanedioate aldolase
MVRRKSNGSGLRESLVERTVLGTFVKLAARESVDIAAGAGFDFAIVDLEHSQLSGGDAIRLVRHAHALGFPAVVRIPANDAGLVNRLLEAGAAGIQLSTVTSVGQVRDLVRSTRYAPDGRRSVSLAHPVAGYGATPLPDAVAAPPPLLVGQIETVDTEDPLDQILAAGLDVAFAGVTDLTVELGFDSGRVRERVEEIRKACEATGVALGAFAAEPSEIPDGARYVALSSDVSLLRAAAAQAVRDAR